MSKKKTHEEFLQEVSGKYGEGQYKFLTKYKKAPFDIKVEHIKCGHIWNVVPWKFLNPKNKFKEPCPSCVKTHISEEFKKKVKNKFGETYILTSKYIDSGTLITVRHNTEKCNEEYSANPTRFLSGKQICPKCKHITTSKEEFRRWFQGKFNSEFELISDYISDVDTVRVLHNKCNKETEFTPRGLKKFKDSNLCSNLRCSDSTNKYNFKDKVYQKYGENYIVIGEYIHSEQDIELKHNIKECGKHFFRQPKHFLTGKTTCPYCANRISRAEEIIAKLLTDSSINHKDEFTFEDCVSTLPLRFDFAIFDYLGNLSYLVEYDGRHHYEPVTFGGRSMKASIEALEVTKRHDSIKNKYCKDNNIPLYRIPYWEFDNVEEIILDIHNGKISTDLDTFLIQK